jgi:hypothetical protein
MAQTSSTIPELGRTQATPTLYNNVVDDITELYGLAGSSGWAVTSDTWTYASAATFTVAGDQTALFRKGTKIRLTQTTVKYFYVTASSYSDPNTTVTITGGTDYTLANAAITDPATSHIENPEGFPQWFNYTPTAAGGGSMTVTALSITSAKFSVQGRTVNVTVNATFTTGGTANPNVSVTLPVESLLSAVPGGGALVVDGGGALTGRASIASGTPDSLTVARYDGANWSLGTARQARFTILYEME